MTRTIRLIAEATAVGVAMLTTAALILIVGA
jgi:hypothetical protein